MVTDLSHQCGCCGVKTLVFGALLKIQGEPTSTAKEVGARLGQGSEFALLLSYIAVGNAQLIKPPQRYYKPLQCSP